MTLKRAQIFLLPVRALLVIWIAGGAAGCATPGRVQSEEKSRELRKALYDRDREAVLYLLQDDFDVNFYPGYNVGPLTIAAKIEDEAIVRRLLELGADVNPDNYASEITQPLAWAADRGNLEIMTILIDAGARPDGENVHAMTPILYAMEGGHREAVALLMAQGVDINKTNRLGVSPFALAFELENWDWVRQFLERGARVNAIYNIPSVGNGVSSLFVAVTHEQLDIVELLLENGANATMRDAGGSTVLEYAERTGNREIIRVIKKARMRR